MNVISALWWRDMLRFKKERSRWFGVVAQPLMFWAIIGLGLSSSFKMPGAEKISYSTFFFPGTLVMCVLFTTVFASISIIEDRAAGFLQGVLVAPAPRSSIVLGKLAGVVTMALVQAALFLLLAPLANYSYANINWLYLTTALLLGCIGLSGLNFAMAWIINSTHGYHAVMSIALIPLWMLSGAMFPLTGPGWLSKIMLLNPMSYFVDAVRVALSGGKFEGAYSLFVQFSGLTVFAIATLLWAISCVKRTGGRV